MNKKSIIGLILELDRKGKEYLFENFEKISSNIGIGVGIKKIANLEYIDLLANYDTKSIEEQIESYFYNPEYFVSQGNLEVLSSLIEDAFREIAERPENEGQFDNIVDYADQVISSDESIISFIKQYKEKFIGNLEESIIPEIDNPVDDFDPTFSSSELSEDVIEKSDGTKYKMSHGIFPIPVDSEGNPILQKTNLLDYAMELMDKATQEGITPELTDQKIPQDIEDYILKNLDYGSLKGSNDKIVSAISDFQRKFDEEFPLLSFFNIKEAILGRMGANSFEELVEKMGESAAKKAYDATIAKIAKGETDSDKRLFSSIQTVRFYDDLIRDFAGYQKKRILNNTVNEQQYDAIMSFAKAAYGDDFLDPFMGSALELHDIARKINKNRSEFQGDIVVYFDALLEQFGGDSSFLESVLYDLFNRVSLKYYKAASNVSKNYGIQQELLRARGNNPNLNKFCSRCGRFRQSDCPRNLLEKDKSNYYTTEESGRRRYKIEDHPDSVFEQHQLMLLSEDARELLNRPCNKENCDVDEYFVDNYFVPPDKTFDNYSFYYGYKPLVIDGEEIPVPLGEDPESIPLVLADQAYQANINQTLEHLSEKSGLSREEIKSILISFIQYGAAVLPPKTVDGENLKTIKSVKNPEYFSEESDEGRAGLAASDRLMSLIRDNLSEANLQRAQKISEKNPTISDEDAKLYIAAKELWRLMPHDYPSGNLTDDILGHQNINDARLNWPSSGVSPFYGLSSDINQFLHIASSTKFLKIQEKVNALAFRLAEEMIAKKGADRILNSDKSELLDECRAMLGAKKLTVPVPVDPLKAGKKYTQEQIDEVREKLLTVSFAESIEALPSTYRQNVDYIGYDIDPEEVVDKVKEYLSQYSTRLRNVLPVDFDATLISEKQTTKRLQDFLSADPFVKKVISYNNCFLFRESMSRAAAAPLNADNVNKAYMEKYGISDYRTLFPLEDYALLLMTEKMSKERKDIDPTIIKISLRDEFMKIHMDSISSKESDYAPDAEELIPNIQDKSDSLFTTMAMALNLSLTPESAAESSTKSFIKDILLDSVLAKQGRLSEYHATVATKDPVRQYSPTKGVPGTTDNIVSYTDALDIFAKYLNSDDDIGLAILDDVHGDNVLFDAQARQLLAAFDLSRKAQRGKDRYASTREALYMASNMVRWGTIPERMRTFNFMGWTNSGVKSMVSTIFSRYGIKWIDNIPLEKYLAIPGGMKTRVTKKSNNNSWYKIAQGKKEDKKKNKIKYVFVFDDGDAQHLIDNAILGNKISTPKRIMMPKMSLIPFEKFGSVFAAINSFKQSGLNVIFVTETDIDFLNKII